MKTEKQYPAKVMLAGEYGVVVGGSALTIPFPRFKATVRRKTDITENKRAEAEQSRRYLGELKEYLRERGQKAFHAGMDEPAIAEGSGEFWLDMDIPVGFGLGSSGAVSAAIYDLYFSGQGQLSLSERREDLAAIESFFHGRSSGVDALTCHTGSPLYFHGESVEEVDFDPAHIPGGYRFFLLDSGERFDTGPLVKHFLESMESKDFAASVRNEYLDFNDKLIGALLGLRNADPALLVRIISDYQFSHFRKMIPDAMADPWTEGQVSNEYYLKLNGSGGGFMLGITHSDTMELLDTRWKDRIIWIG